MQLRCTLVKAYLTSDSGDETHSWSPPSTVWECLFARPDKEVRTVYQTNTSNIEILTTELSNCTVTSVYKPPNAPYYFSCPPNFNAHPVRFVLGNFNSHSENWGYRTSDDNGVKVEEWVDGHIPTIFDPWSKTSVIIQQRSLEKGLKPWSNLCQWSHRSPVREDSKWCNTEDPIMCQALRPEG